MELTERKKIVVEKFGGVISYCEVFYIISILNAASMALESFREMDRSYSEKRGDEFVFNHAHQAFIQIAILSKFFLSKRNPLAKARAKKLLSGFSLSGNEPFLDTNIRNALEHYDERMDEYLLTNDAGQFFPMPIVGANIGYDEGGLDKIFKLIDVQKRTIVIRGNRFAFVDFEKQIEEIRLRAKEMMKNGRLNSKKANSG